ncbi:hypothetical protein TNCV_1926701 [Trichonephila clavipes]|nr:hypothetical protein TNCV_1926701 [Trichonephila clavipes]
MLIPGFRDLKEHEPGDANPKYVEAQMSSRYRGVEVRGRGYHSLIFVLISLDRGSKLRSWQPQPLSKLTYNSNARTSSHDRFTVNQLLYILGLQGRHDSNPPHDNAGYQFVTMTSSPSQLCCLE